MTRQTERAASQYLDVHGFAELLGVSVATVYRWKADPRIDLPPAISVGTRTRWRQETVAAWAAAQEAKGAQGAA